MLPGRIGTALGMTGLIERSIRRQRAMFESIDAFVVLTERAAEIVRANGAPPSKVVVNRLGVRNHIVTPMAQRTSAPDGVVRVGYVGRFEDVKGVVDLAEAMRRVPPDVPIRLELRGPAQTPSDREVRTRVAELTASDPRVTIADGVSPEQVLDLLRTYDVLCCPSRCLEGGPTVALEAMAAGVPVVAASVGGVAEVVEDGVNARLVPPGAVDRLTDALIEVARNPRTTIREWKRRLPAPRTMRDVAMDYLSLYSGGAREFAVARHA
jgi:glycosyltransferase involved in cell wall biosynthesis